MKDRDRRREQRRARKRQRAQEKRGKQGAGGRKKNRARVLLGGGPPVPPCPPVPTRHLDAITDHVERYVGPVSAVIHEEASEYVHVDVLVVKPSAERPWWTLVTSGMSDAPMRARSCEHHEYLSHAELMLCLPPEWQVGSRDRFWAWPWLLLAELARMPHRLDTWLGWAHSVPLDRDQVGPNAPFTGLVLLPPATLPDDFSSGLVVAGRQIDMLGLVFLHPRELRVKVERGIDALVEEVGWDSLTELLDLERPCGVRRRAG